MRQTVSELLDEEEFGTVLTLLDREEKRCLQIGNRKLTGYGSAAEMDKREQWKEKAKYMRALATKISAEFY
ncbi:hypothetical protein [Litoribacter populi]|uniref:hypothetical protein n=1 Tax=Litoribacter populi TaxID=2598460 RepID=UPI00117D3694|nr:hypothetical protein [Litoribacter populi]